MDLKQTLAGIGVERLSGMQSEAYNLIAGTDKDVVVISPTGTGKTLAYMLPLAEILDPAADSLQAVVVVPGRELAMQSAAVMASLRTGVRTVCCYGGRPAMDEHRIIKDVRPQVVFGTPGRLNDHIAKGNLSPYSVRVAIVDEFDKCMEMGFQNEMSKLFKSLAGLRRRFLLSATDMEQIPGFVNIRSAVKLDYSAGGVSSRVSQYVVRSELKDKLQALDRLLCVLGGRSSMVFLNYRDSVERVAAYLSGRGFCVSAYHGGLEQDAREMALFKFANGTNNILVSTDLASRGLDIQAVDNIIHYHLPQTAEAYIHRVGRTARWASFGSSFFILSSGEEVPEFVSGECPEYAMPGEIPPPALSKMATVYIGKGKKDKISKGDVVGFLCKKAGLGREEIGRVDVMERYAYAAVLRSKLPQVLEKADGEKIKGIRTIVAPIK